MVLAPTPAPTPAPATPDPTPTGICAGSTPPYVCAASVFPQLQYSAVEDDLPSFQAAFIGNLSSSLGFVPEAIEVTALRRAYDPRGSLAVDWTLNATANQEALDVEAVLGDSGADLLGGMLSPYGEITYDRPINMLLPICCVCHGSVSPSGMLICRSVGDAGY